MCFEPLQRSVTLAVNSGCSRLEEFLGHRRLVMYCIGVSTVIFVLLALFIYLFNNRI